MKASSKEIVELFGIFAVVASLIFVGMQLMLDRKVALAEHYYYRAESAKADRRTMLESDAYMQLASEQWALGIRPHYWDEDWKIARLIEEGKISVKSIEANILTHQLHVIGYDSLYFQYKQGLLGETTWDGLRNSLKWQLSQGELTRAVFEQHTRQNLKPVIDEILREIDSELPTKENDHQVFSESN